MPKASHARAAKRLARFKTSSGAENDAATDDFEGIYTGRSTDPSDHSSHFGPLTSAFRLALTAHLLG